MQLMQHPLKTTIDGPELKRGKNPNHRLEVNYTRGKQGLMQHLAMKEYLVSYYICNNCLATVFVS